MWLPEADFGKLLVGLPALDQVITCSSMKRKNGLRNSLHRIEGGLNTYLVTNVPSSQKTPWPHTWSLKRLLSILFPIDCLFSLETMLSSIHSSSPPIKTEALLDLEGTEMPMKYLSSKLPFRKLVAPQTATPATLPTSSMNGMSSGHPLPGSQRVNN